jgi:radical SAM protein with 4Fe4S-binding SPASM domain
MGQRDGADMKELLDTIGFRPKVCVWELTARCNMRCLHCGSNLGSPRKQGADLTLDECLRLCHELSALGCEEVALSGGEPLLSDHWEEVARSLSILGIRVSLMSNGFLLDSDTALRARRAGIGLVGLSLDGTEATHNRIRQHPQSFARLCEAIAHARRAGLEVCLVTHLNTLNLGELPDLETFAAAESVEVWQLQLGILLGGMAEHAALAIRPADLPAVADFILAARRRGRVVVSVADSIGYHSRHERDLRSARRNEGIGFWCGCTAGCLVVGIEHDGNVLGCLSLQDDRFVEGNVRQQTLGAIWYRKGSFAYTREFRPELLRGNCKDCEFGELCRGGCTAVAFGATGRPHDNPYCLRSVAARPARVAAQAG